MFSHEYITDRIIRIRDASFTAVYLILGDHKNALIDTGVGIGSIKDYITSAIGKQVDLVILTHGHPDHACGAYEFRDLPIWLHPADRDLMKRHQEPSGRIGMVERAYAYYHLQRPKIADKDVLDQIDPNDTLPMEDGELFELGGVTLQGIHAPGHTQGMMMVLIKEERTILFGDGCGVGVLLVEDCCSTVAEYRRSLEKIRNIETEYDHILRNHGTCVSPKRLLNDMIEVCDEILEGKDDRIPTTSVIESEYPVYQAKETFSGTQDRVDGKIGNIIYAENKIR